MFISFANFYQRFIQSFSRIAALFIFLLKTIGLSKLVPKAFRVDDDKVVNSGNGKTNETVVNLSKQLTRMPNIRAIKKPIFLTPNANKAFNQLRLAFIKASILRHFDLKSYIWIKTDVSSYAIDENIELTKS